MGRVEHRRWRGGSAPRAGLRRLPVVGRVFVAMAVVAVVIELWPVVNAIWIGATTWPADVPLLLPNAARAAGMVVLPAAVAWASPTRYRANDWLWKGALLVAVVQAVRYPVGFARDALLNTLIEGGAELGDPVPMLVNLGVGLGLAVLAILGVWALGEGLKDAGGRSVAAVVVAAVVAIALGLLLVVPAFMAGVVLDLNLVLNLVSVLVNMLYLFADALLAGRAVAGALGGVSPRRAWRAGAIGGSVVFLVPVLSLVALLANTFLLSQDAGVSFPFLGVATYFGWPLVALALAMGMGRLAAPAPRAVSTGFVMRGRIRHTPAPTA